MARFLERGVARNLALFSVLCLTYVVLVLVESPRRIGQTIVFATWESATGKTNLVFSDFLVPLLVIALLLLRRAAKDLSGKFALVLAHLEQSATFAGPERVQLARSLQATVRPRFVRAAGVVLAASVLLVEIPAWQLLAGDVKADYLNWSMLLYFVTAFTLTRYFAGSALWVGFSASALVILAWKSARRGGLFAPRLDLQYIGWWISPEIRGGLKPISGFLDDLYPQPGVLAFYLAAFGMGLLPFLVLPIPFYIGFVAWATAIGLTVFFVPAFLLHLVVRKVLGRMYGLVMQVPPGREQLEWLDYLSRVERWPIKVRSLVEVLVSLAVGYFFLLLSG